MSGFRRRWENQWFKKNTTIGLSSQPRIAPSTKLATPLAVSRRATYLGPPPLHSAALRRTATVMRNGSHVFDRLDRQARRLQGRNRAFATGAGTFDQHLQLLHSELGRLLGGLLGGALAGKRSALAASLEAAGAGAGPTKGVAFGVGNGDHRVIERRPNMGHAL